MTISGSKSSRIEGSGRRRDSSYRRFGSSIRSAAAGPTQRSKSGSKGAAFLTVMAELLDRFEWELDRAQSTLRPGPRVGAGLHSVASEHFLVGGERDGE